MIYYVIKMIYYAIFCKNLLVPVDIFNRYQCLWEKKDLEKKGLGGGRTWAAALRMVRVTAELQGDVVRKSGKNLKIQIFQVT